jgi:hypothetical protein
MTERQPGRQKARMSPPASMDLNDFTGAAFVPDLWIRYMKGKNTFCRAGFQRSKTVVIKYR